MLSLLHAGDAGVWTSLEVLENRQTQGSEYFSLSLVLNIATETTIMSEKFADSNSSPHICAEDAGMKVLEVKEFLQADGQPADRRYTVRPVRGHANAGTRFGIVLSGPPGAGRSPLVLALVKQLRKNG